MKTPDWRLARQIALALAVAAMVAGAWLAPLESVANQQVDAGLKRALISFASARALNAIISVAQGTEVAIQPAGVGVNLAPGQLLDPLNDLVEQFSQLMLAASIAFGIEKVLISIGAHWVISLVLTATAIGWAACHLRQHAPPIWLTRILVLLLMTRFAMPLAIIGSDLLFQEFMAADYQSSQGVIDSASSQLDRLNPPAPLAAEDQGMLDKLKGWLSQNADVKTRLGSLKNAAEQAIERIIKLMVIFLLQTLLLPLFLLWALWGVTRRSFEMPRQTRQRDAT